jgi:hypothetical protein
MSVRIGTIGLAVAAVLLCVGESRAASWFEKSFWMTGPRYDGVLPACDAPQALEQIRERFVQKEARFWNSQLQILGFEAVRETAFRPWASDTIPRRFCSGIVEISDGRRRPLHFWIGEDTGMIGADFGVEWCVVGLDRNWAFNPACKMAKP